MIDTDDMQEFHGGLDHVINFPEGLSEQGAQYFVQGLTAWKERVTFAAQIKVDDLKAQHVDIEQLLRDEAEAYYEGNLFNDALLGPVSLLQSCYHVKYANVALKYMARHQKMSDEDLYNTMRDCGYFADLSVFLPEYKNYPTPSRALLNILSTMEDAQMITTDQECCNDSMRHVMRLFRTAQYDLFSPVEKKLFMHGLNYYQTPHPLPFDRYIQRGFTSSAIDVSTSDQRANDINQAYDMDVYDVFPVEGRYFLALNEAFSTVAQDPHNAQNFLLAQRVNHSFNLVQAYAHEAIFKALSFDEFMNQRAKGQYQSTVYPQEYKAYHAQAHAEARMPLLSPEGMKNHHAVYMNCDNFTDTFYRKEMTVEGQKSFDNLLQNKLDQVAEEAGFAPVNVPEFREKIAAFHVPRL